ncbi:hypothetical protein [Amycolatopsis sp. NPDC059020]|uniref:hypothetical protein n=1 Tax=Amycolatopsis sp. NPDC059020 TaxID=3346703 RepID=UPI00366EFEE5
MAFFLGERRRFRQRVRRLTTRPSSSRAGRISRVTSAARSAPGPSGSGYLGSARHRAAVDELGQLGGFGNGIFHPDAADQTARDGHQTASA